MSAVATAGAVGVALAIVAVAALLCLTNGVGLLNTFPSSIATNERFSAAAVETAPVAGWGPCERTLPRLGSQRDDRVTPRASILDLAARGLIQRTVVAYALLPGVRREDQQDADWLILYGVSPAQIMYDRSQFGRPITYRPDMRSRSALMPADLAAVAIAAVFLFAGFGVLSATGLLASGPWAVLGATGAAYMTGLISVPMLGNLLLVAYLIGHLSRLGPTLTALYQQITYQGIWAWLLPMAIALTLACLVTRRMLRLSSFYALTGVGVFLVTVWAYVAGTLPLSWWLGTSASRVVDGTMFVAAAALLSLTGALVSPSVRRAASYV